MSDGRTDGMGSGGSDDDDNNGGGGFVLFSAATQVVESRSAGPSAEEAAAAWRRARWQTARARFLPARRQARVYDRRRDGVDAGVFGYDAWVRNPLLARLPAHGRLRTAGVVVLSAADVEEALDPALAKQLKARAKNQRRRHAKQAAKKAAAAAAAASAEAATATAEAAETTKSE